MHSVEKFEIFEVRGKKARLQLHNINDQHAKQAHLQECYQDENGISQDVNNSGFSLVGDSARDKKMNAQNEGRVHDLSTCIAVEQDES